MSALGPRVYQPCHTTDALTNMSTEEELVEAEPVIETRHIAGVDDKDVAHSKSLHEAEKKILERKKGKFVAIDIEVPTANLRKSRLSYHICRYQQTCLLCLSVDVIHVD